MDYANGKSISREEQMIWDELECEIEKYLEEEIKDGLSMLARRLQILYQQKKRSKIHDEAAPDLCIVIKLGIGCDIDIKDGNLEDDRSRPYTPYSEPCLKNCNPDRHSTSQFGSSKASLTMSKRGSITCTSSPLRKRSKNRKTVWKY